ncbi:MAG: hypothetical protein JXK93_07940 [Sphaerochaetaceae bacterium]|nr:hypothetical protein [Sphaerochaetaceae bacterium]
MNIFKRITNQSGKLRNIFVERFKHLYFTAVMESVRLWTTTDPDTYQKLLLYIAVSVDKSGKKIKIGESVEQAVKETLERPGSSNE